MHLQRRRAVKVRIALMSLLVVVLSMLLLVALVDVRNIEVT
jgi:hypothetical protein